MLDDCCLRLWWPSWESNPDKFMGLEATAFPFCIHGHIRLWADVLHSLVREAGRIRSPRYKSENLYRNSKRVCAMMQASPRTFVTKLISNLYNPRILKVLRYRKLPLHHNSCRKTFRLTRGSYPLCNTLRTPSQPERTARLGH